MILAAVSLSVLLLDQLTKRLVLHFIPLGGSVPVLPGLLDLTYTQNPGTAFGLLAGLGHWIRYPFFVAVLVLAAVLIFSYERGLPPGRRLPRIALGLIWGGALGNFLDRILYGRVVDFVDCSFHGRHWYVFNLADSGITVGIGFLIWEFFLKDGRKAA